MRRQGVLSLAAAVAVYLSAFAPAHGALTAHAAQPSSSNPANGGLCSAMSYLCTDVSDSDDIFGKYIGHDEPSTLFVSSQPGSGTRSQWLMTLPSDPPASPTTGNTYNFELRPAFWFGMAMCDTQSAPHPAANTTCAAGTDNNIHSGADLMNHPGSAFTEMQFYPPGWVKWGSGGNSCDATKWCAALNIDSLSVDSVTGQQNNSTCVSGPLGGNPEYVNFAFITKNGVPQAPPNPVNQTATTFTPDASKDLFMNSGDKILTTMHDTASGLEVDIQDLTTGVSGLMVSSATNGFGMVKWDPAGSGCTNIAYDYHPMYSTSGTDTRVPWSAHTYNIAFSDEIGHFDTCDTAVLAGNCTVNESDGELSDGDDTACHPGSAALAIAVDGCRGQNNGFDGIPYKANWPDGSANHPTSVGFSSPFTGSSYNTPYQSMAFEVNLPSVEANATGLPTCNRITGADCTLFPVTDESTAGTPLHAPFYPFFSTSGVTDNCTWNLGNDIPGTTTNDFGKNNQYGSLFTSEYLAFGGGGTRIQRINNFRQDQANPCNTKNGNLVGSVTCPGFPAPHVTSVAPPSGPFPGGTQVTITGCNLTGATSVTFNGAAALFTVIDDSTIVATSPPSPLANGGPVQVVVGNSDGSSQQSAATQFSYGPPGSTGTTSTTGAGTIPNTVGNLPGTGTRGPAAEFLLLPLLGALPLAASVRRRWRRPSPKHRSRGR